MTPCTFTPGSWEASDFRFAWSPRVRSLAKFAFTQEPDCIVNGPNGEDFDYVSMLTNETFTPGVTLKTTCAFEKFGAPLLVFSGDLQAQPDGTYRFGRHFEVVAYEDGFNLWRLEPDGDTLAVTKLLGVHFPVTAGKPHQLAVKITADRLTITLDEHTAELPVADIPSAFHVGITACEGINRFYDFTVE